MGTACSYCGEEFRSDNPAPFGLCPACLGRLEDEMTDAAVRVGRVRPDAETVLDIPVPAGRRRPPRRPRPER